MSENNPEETPEDQQQQMAEVQEQLDAESDEDGLGAEAGRSEENGISQG
jgi:hypothetical protein